MDRTLVNLASILVAGAGLFAVLTDFKVPQLNMSFWGENPYAVKHDIIESTMTWVFTIVALAGLFFQLWAEIWGANLPDRTHPSNFYIGFSAVGLVVVIVLVLLLAQFGQVIARWQWKPRIIASQHELFERAAFVIAHDGWEQEKWEDREAITTGGDAERYKAAAISEATARIAQIEELLELRPRGDLKQRLAALTPLFSK